jgi:hypothetical protein
VAEASAANRELPGKATPLSDFHRFIDGNEIND